MAATKPASDTGYPGANQNNALPTNSVYLDGTTTDEGLLDTPANVIKSGVLQVDQTQQYLIILVAVRYQFICLFNLLLIIFAKLSDQQSFLTEKLFQISLTKIASGKAGSLRCL